MKKLGLLFVTIIMMMLFAVSASALEPTGQCGDNVYWEYDSVTEELVISGEGEMWNYYGNAPFRLSSIFKSVVIEYGVTSIGDSTFYTESFSWFTSITIPDSVTSIGEKAFFNCDSLTNIIIPNSVTSIGYKAFHSCDSLTNITIPNSVTSIGEEAFYNCDSLTNITIPNSVTSIGERAFFNCDSLTNITIPDSVTSIGSYAFSRCINLTNIIIPDSVIDIGACAFQECIRLEELAVSEKTEKFDTSAINGCSSLRCLVIKNPECEIVMEKYIIPNRVVLSGYTASTTEQFAFDKGYHFLPLDGENAGTLQNHQFFVDYWKTILPATCTERGLMVKVCNICSDVESEVISPLGHTDKNSDNVCDSCDVTIATDKTPTQQPNQPEAETPQVEKNFFEKIIEWFRNLFNNLFGWL